MSSLEAKSFFSKKNEKLFFGAALYLLVTALLNTVWPELFFSKVSVPWVWGVAGIGSLILISLASCLRRLREARRRAGRANIEAAERHRPAVENPGPQQRAASAKLLERLIGHAGEDLKEIRPDFTLASLRRLEKSLPALLEESADPLDARILLGIVGVYLGETLRAAYKGEWRLGAAPSLGRFTYQACRLRFSGKEWDPFFAARRWFASEVRWRDLVEEVRKCAENG